MTSWLSKPGIKRKLIITVTNIPSEIKCYEHILFDIDNINYHTLINTIQSYKDKFKNIKNIVNVYKPKYKNNKNATGLGDFIRGSYLLYQMCDILQINFNMNMKYHPINYVLSNKSVLFDIDSIILDNIEHTDLLNYAINVSSSNIISFYTTFLKSCLDYLLKCKIHDDTIYVYIIAFPIFKSNTTINTFMRNTLFYNYMMKEYIYTNIKDNNIELSNYSVIHIRTGDRYLMDNKTNLSVDYYNKINKIVTQNIDINKIYIIISDNIHIKNNIVDKFTNIIQLNNKIKHLGEGTDLSNEDIISNMLDFYIMSYSKDILSISSYIHGSGFSKWCSEIYSIPYMVHYCE